MTRKDSELNINVKSSLQKFAGFIKAMVLTVGLLTAGVGGKIGYDNINADDNFDASACKIEIERKLGEYNSRLTKVETRLDGTDVNILEIKASLIRIESYLMNHKGN